MQKMVEEINDIILSKVKRRLDPLLLLLIFF